MKSIPRPLLAVMIAFVLAFPACNKSAKTPPIEMEGVQVDIPKLKQAFASANTDLLALENDVEFGLRYGNYEKSLLALEQITNNASCTEVQKKVAGDTMDQTKRLMEKTPPPPSQ